MQGVVPFQGRNPAGCTKLKRRISSRFTRRRRRRRRIRRLRRRRRRRRRVKVEETREWRRS